MRVLSLFSGVGAFEKSLDRLNIDYELVNYCEVDKYASCAYSAIHNVSEDKNLWDVSKVDTSELSDIDLLTHGSPCQDFSVAGNQKGGDKDSGTRSSLMWHTVRIVNDTKPKYVLWEQVPNILSDKHRHNFDKYLDKMESMGYNNYYKKLNSKDFGVPQNRVRLFTISIRKDIDDGNFKMPVSPAENQMSLFRDVEEYEDDVEFKVLKDVLEDEVDEKYYLSDEYLKRFTDNLNDEKLQKKIPNNILGTTQTKEAEGTNSRHWVHDVNGIVGTLSATDHKQPKQLLEVKQIGQTSNKGSQAGKVYDNEGIFPTVCAGTHGYAMGYTNDKQPILRKHDEWEIQDKDYAQCLDAHYSNFPDNHGARTGVLEKIVCEQRSDEGLRFFDGDYCGTIRTIDSGGDKRVIELEQVGGLKDGQLELNPRGSYSQGARIYSENGTSCTLSTEGSGLYMVNQLGGVRNGEVDLKNTEGYSQSQRVYDINGISPTISAGNKGGGKRPGGLYLTNYRIRRLTPLECFRLQDFNDEDYYKAKKALEDKFYNGNDRSDSRCYKMTGNSITVKVVEKIFENLFLA